LITTSPTYKLFSLIVHEALMIEPTETESKKRWNACGRVLKIAEEAKNEPALLKDAPHNTPVGRLNEVKAPKT
jgi:glycine dehydrogenase subunit 2